MSFWNDFKTLLNYRISYRIQNIFFNAYDNAKRAAHKQELKNTINENRDDLLEQMYNNNFGKRRYGKKK